MNPAATPPRAPTGVDDAWVFETNDDQHFEYARQCAPSDDSGVDGRIVRDTLNSAGAPLGSFAHLRFDAPAGTTLSRLRLWRYAGKNENDWRLYTRTADGSDLSGSDCPVDAGFFCEVGGAGPLAFSDWAVNTSSLRVGFSCSNAMTSCATGATLHEVWTGIYSALVTVDDTTAPTASGATGSLLAGGYLHGSVTAGVTAANDSTGIRGLQVRVDGDRVVATTPDRPSCDFSRRAPCDQLTGPESFSFDSANIGDGVHTAQIGVLDAGRNFTAAGTRQITVDNGAPFAPTPTSPTTMTTTGATTAVVSWADPPGQTAPISRAHVTVCGPGGCTTTVQPDTGTATVSVASGVGSYVASVALEDAVGNFAPGNAATWTISVVPVCACAAISPLPATRPAPAPTSKKASAHLSTARPTVARDRRTVAVRGSVAATVTGRVTVTASARIRGRTRTATRRVPIRSRRYAARLRLPSSAWRRATVTVRFAGDARHAPARATRTVRQRR